MHKVEAENTKNLLEFLGGSWQRVLLFHELDGGLAKGDMEATFKDGFLRKNLPEFRKHGLLKENGDEYMLTELGKQLFELFGEINDIAQLIDDLGVFLAAVPNWDETLPSLDHIEGAEIVADDCIFPYRTVKRYNQEICDASHVKEVISWVNSSEDFHEANDDLTAEYVYPEEVKSQIESNDELVARAKELQAAGRAKYWVIDQRPPFNITITDHSAIVWTDRYEEFDGGAYTVLLRHDSEEFVSWANDVFDATRRDARKIEWT